MFDGNGKLLVSQSITGAEIVALLEALAGGNRLDADAIELIDAGALYTATDVEAALTEVMIDVDAAEANIVTAQADIITAQAAADAAQADIDGFDDELKDLVTAEIQQLENIGATTISAAQWGYVGALDQALATTDDPQFATLKIGTATAKGAFTLDKTSHSFCINIKADLADDGSIALEDYITSPLGILWIIDTTNATAVGSFFIRGAVNAVTIIDDPMTKLAIADTDTKLCCIADGDSTYTLKNRLGGVRNFTLMHLGK